MAKIAHVNYVFLQAVTPSVDVRGFPEEIFDRASLQDPPRSMKLPSFSQCFQSWMYRSADWIKGSRRPCSKSWNLWRCWSLGGD